MISAFAERLAKLQAKHHRDLAVVIASLDDQSHDEFVLAIQAVLCFTSLKPVELGDGLSVGLATVNRWATGHSSPHPLICRTVRTWLVRELSQRADMIEAFSGELGTPQDDYIPRRYLPLES